LANGKGKKKKNQLRVRLKRIEEGKMPDKQDETERQFGTTFYWGGAKKEGNRHKIKEHRTHAKRRKRL